MPGLFDRTAPECRDFAIVVEELLARRRGEAAHARRPRRGWPREGWGLKRWTREELCDDAYSSYKALLKGSIRRPPRRTVVLAIADYLECTLAERNRLLVAAQYAPQQPYLTGAALTAALARAQETMGYVPLPAYVVTREWDVRSVNAHLLTLVGATGAQVDAIPPEERNILHLVFDPSLPLYERLSGTPEAWERTARCGIYSFKRDNVLCEDEAWYRHRVQRLLGVPRFAEYWRQIQIDLEARGDGFVPASGRPDTIEITHPTGTVSVEALTLAGAENLAGKVLIDLANELDFSHGMPPVCLATDQEDGSVGGRIQRAFPGARVVKALNTMSAPVMVNPQQLAEGDHTVFICGNDAAAKDTVAQLLRSFGWRDIFDLGDITAAHGPEMLMALWVRCWQQLGNVPFNVKLVR